MKNLPAWISHLIPAPHHYAYYRNDAGTLVSEWLVGWTVAGKGKVVGLILTDDGRSVVRSDQYTNFVKYGVA